MDADDHQHADLHHLIARLENRLTQLRRDVDAKADARPVEELRDDLSRYTDHAEQLERRVDEAGEAVDAVERDLTRRLDETTARLERRLRWLDRHVRASTGARTADLDAGPDLVALAARAERGANLEADLLPEARRRILQADVAELRRWRVGHGRAVRATVDASLAVARSEPGSPTRSTAAREFAAARLDLDDYRQTSEHVTEAADRAAAVLAADDERRGQRAEAIDDGRSSHDALRTSLRTRLAGMIDRAEMPPVWFDAVLGPGPPAEAGPWLETAVDLLVHRVTYGITDAAVALGDPPGPDASPRRRESHHRIATRLAPHRS
ncbi:hypothetical protein [Pseudonocardia abyssalis]|uniref:Uncharacterized protein n=1 Tax=Pseudonocardia abyssalis TaxID=2792008 RepID=A0ABS6UR10_9PSEU|nr:hypothetical protein [Pseudonocardia abyssalis]MBW0116674.1 hypothetical protein [Pseudonocardia abyssalis]MBW0134679.1 hypothetical protein [Pseudonocardia abyssalis]